VHRSAESLTGINFNHLQNNVASTGIDPASPGMSAPVCSRLPPPTTSIPAMSKRKNLLDINRFGSQFVVIFTLLLEVAHLIRC
jgi:hypothetical protein